VSRGYDDAAEPHGVSVAESCGPPSDCRDVAGKRMQVKQFANFVYYAFKSNIELMQISTQINRGIVGELRHRFQKMLSRGPACFAFMPRLRTSRIRSSASSSSDKIHLRIIAAVFGI
jgi:hypothetical protein